MAEAVKQEIEEIKTLISADKSLAYSSFLQLQRNSAEDTLSMETLTLCSPPLLPAILSDIFHQEEEIAAQALKCLGFMMYHPSLVSSIPDASRSALDSLARLIVTTKMKAICNLGVWCFSIQQLDGFIIECCIDTILGAVYYAIDNPFNSLSTTFEAIQAVMKLATQLPNKLRVAANQWLPPIYRRLISYDKKERDITQRCLMKIKSIILPSPPALSKALVHDLKSNLVARIMDMQHDCSMEVCIIQAWGWYVCLLGPSLLNNRQLVNQMLKIPEHTFTSADPQVQIASLVAWEHLIDAFPPSEINIVQEAVYQEKIPDCSRISERSNGELDKDLLRRIAVLMVPLQGIISKKCDIIVQMSCLNTWHYLLHKLDLLVNHPSILQTTFRPMTKMVFSKKISNENICLWKPCLELFDQYISGIATSKGMNLVPTRCPCDVTNENDILLSYFSGRFPWINSIKWIPWKISDLDFSLMIIRTIVSHCLTTQKDPEIRTFALSSSLKIFKSVIHGVKSETKGPSVHCHIIQLCLNTILKFIKEFGEDISSINDWNHYNDLLWMLFQSVEIVREELGFLLASPHCLITLDFLYIKDGKSSEVTCCPFFQAMGKGSVSYMDMVSPMIYTTYLLLCMLAHFVLHFSEKDGIPLAIPHKFIFSLNPSVNLHTIVCFLYVHLSKPFNAKLSSLVMWRIIAKDLMKNMDKVFVMPVSKAEGPNPTHAVLYCFICYPFVLCCPKSMDDDRSRLSLIFSQRDLLLETLVEVCNTLFGSLNNQSNECIQSSKNDFSNGLSELLIKVLDEKKILAENSENIDSFLLFSEMLICILVHIKPLDMESLQLELGVPEIHFSTIKNTLVLFGRFLGISLTILKINQQCGLEMICRVFTAHIRLASNLCLKQDVFMLLEVISNPLVQWFSFCEPLSKGIRGRLNHLLYCLWTNTLSCLQGCHPAISFDSTLLRVLAPSLRAAVDHPYLPIGNTTIEFWKATYGKKGHLDCPECLLPILSKLSRNKPQKKKIRTYGSL
ncbi:uncharacterized protein LOC110032622 isoform X2 [Phalaenopsis equestris]|uniref:uncharacterized protein LOC110032622 isoform X2 n=1 Tax=Phalaenopsis equestris TaxID=78828 RepID=UPI0009E504E8|nr:uncharacterized protein LOC110032622 isoform X2 [Phalaenopsis equestris]